MRSFTRNRISQTLATRSVRAIAAVALVGMFTGACERKSALTEPTVVSITVSPNPQSLAINGTQQFSAVARDASGAIVTITPVWSVVAGGGTISSSGLFTAGTTLGTFTSTVKATSGSSSGTATVTVTAGPLASITLTPTPVSLAIGTTQLFVAVGKDAGGNVVPITPVFSVESGGGTIASTSGLFTAGMTTGTFANTVKATSGGISATATVTVTAGPVATIVVTPNPATLAIGTTQPFTAVGKDAGGNTVPITPTWFVVAGGGTISSTGLFTAGTSVGTFPNTIQANSGGLTGTATVNVTAGPLSTIIVTPNPVTLDAGRTQLFTAAGRDASGNAVAITPVWSVVNGGGTIDANTGLFTAGNVAGTFSNTIKVTSGSVTAFATVTVNPALPTTIVVLPNPASVQTGGTQQFTAIGRDANGNTVPITPVWSVVNGGGSIDASTGVFTAGLVTGTFTNTVKATSSGVAGFATVRVTPGPVTTIVVTPNPAFVSINNSLTFTATARDANGNIVAISPVWSVINGGGTINASTGVFTAGGATGTFLNTVQATSGAVSGTATVNVTGAAPAPIVSLGSAASNGIMAGQSVTCINLGIINADVAISPGNTITGFGPCVITGVRHLNDAVAIQNQLDLTAAYNTLAGLPCPPANFIVANLGGTTKAAGVYCSASSIGITGVLTLDGGGDPNATFVFQAGSTLTTAGNIVLINGAQAKNVYFQVGSSATIGTASQIQGNIIALTSITLVDNATLIGRALARNGSVTLGTNNVITLP